ncbi:MAG: hypothetical protein DRP09_12940 [Candidatus Thorarchaeota archaeon]|nr:MAG: hypothetical protein DRP09_12940 [Candidatus Thorarchaeota archaeon]
MSQFIRMLIEWFRQQNINLEEEHEIIFKIRRRKKWYKPSKEHRELLKELKQVLKKRKIG